MCLFFFFLISPVGDVQLYDIVSQYATSATQPLPVGKLYEKRGVKNPRLNFLQRTKLIRTFRVLSSFSCG